MRLILFAVFSILWPLAPKAATASLHPIHNRPSADTGDLYGVTVPKTDSTLSKPAVAEKTKDSAAAKPDASAARKDSSVKAAADTLAKKTPAPDTSLKAHRDTAVVKTMLPVQDTSAAAKASVDTGEIRKPRQHLVRETTINPMDEHKGHYRSPKKALFMSLVVPGLGQAYVGQSASNYVRAGIYLGIDVALGIFWYHYVVVKQDAEVAKYRRFADTAWSQNKYEDSIQSHSNNSDDFNAQNPSRETYCQAAQSTTGGGNALLDGCEYPVDSASSYQAFHDVVAAHNYSNVTPASAQVDSIEAWRAGFPNAFSFYEIIGKEQEFISGWNDAVNVVYGDSSVSGTSALRDQYLGMRSTANTYARMQAWFFGGIVVNHIVSALDAALTAHYNNMALYETKTSWYDHIHLNSGLAFDGPWPRTSVVAAVTF